MPPTPRNGLDCAACGRCPPFSGLDPGSPPPWRATTERVVVNRYSGVAIEGFDPVAYFTDGAAVRGMPDHEAAAGRRGLALPQ